MTDSIRFPPEIFDGILDHVHNLDEEARSTYSGLDISIRKITTKPVKNLLSCSLVRRSWLPRTRLHSFNTIYLPHDGTIGIAFGALVAHPLCTFRSHVRRLRLHEGYDPAGALWVNSVLPRLALLTNVEDVSIYHAQFTNLAEEEWRAGVQFFGPQLKCLSIQSTQFDRIIRLTELISHCTSLEHLTLLFIYKDEEPRSPPQGGSDIIIRTPPSRFLRSLTLRHGISMSAEFLEWLCPSPGAIEIPAVELRNISVKNAHHVSRFLHAVGPSITTLAIGFSDSSVLSTDGQDAFCRVADLTTLTNLESLQFGLLTNCAIDLRRGLSVKHIPPILAKLDTPFLREIRFHVLTVEQAVHFEKIDWESIVPTLNSARYPALEVLSFRPIKEDSRAWLDEHVKRKLRRNVEVRCATT